MIVMTDMGTTSTYIGDGVYASFDGYHLTLTTGHHDPVDADNIVHLEPGLLTLINTWVKAGHPDYNTGLKHESHT